MTAVPALKWRKASRSGPDADCVELAHTLGAVRDSKNPATVLTVDVLGLVQAIRSGRLVA